MVTNRSKYEKKICGSTFCLEKYFSLFVDPPYNVEIISSDYICLILTKKILLFLFLLVLLLILFTYKCISLSRE